MIDTHFSFPLLIILTLIACTATGYGDALTLRTIAKGSFSGITKATEEVIKDNAAWEKTWAQHNRDKRAEGKVPEIDFAKAMAVVVTMGQQRTGGYAIEIVKVESVDKRLKIWVRRKTPPPGAMLIQALTVPFHIVAVPKSDLRPEFVEMKGE